MRLSTASPRNSGECPELHLLARFHKSLLYKNKRRGEDSQQIGRNEQERLALRCYEREGPAPQGREANHRGHLEVHRRKGSWWWAWGDDRGPAECPI